MRYRYSTGRNGRPVKTALVYTKDEHGIKTADIDSEAVGIVRKLRESGYESYIVGGAVRDIILGKKPKDFDIASGASPLQIRRIFRNSRIIGRRFKLVHVYFGSVIYEVSTFRSLRDGLTGNTFGTIGEDVQRRDFTMNALFYDPLQETVVDYVGGMKDIKAKRVRAIIPLATIFKDDPIRMLRAAKYAASSDFALPLSLKVKIKKQAALLTGVSPSRLTEEISKIVRSPSARRIVQALENLGLYAYLQPAASRMMKENPGFRLRYMESLEALGDPGFKNRPGEALGVLVNDYLDDAIDTAAGTAESYKAAYSAARGFLQPMTPPRFELEYSLRRFFASKGVQVRKTQFTEKDRPKTENTEGGTGEEGPKRKKRRHRPRPAKPAS
jgi:poly(A) polymerase